MSYKCYEIRDDHNPAKTHVFHLYSDSHVAYNQRIWGNLYYSRFVRINRRHGYYRYFKLAKTNSCEGCNNYFGGCDPKNCIRY